MNLRLLTTAASLCLLLTPNAHAILDINGNGLSDLWEKQYNNQQLLPPEFDPQADPDHDGWTNAEEAAAGTDPFNSITGILRPAVSHTPAFQTDSDGDGIPETLTPATLHLSWPSTHGKQYSLLHSSHPGNHGQPLEAPFIGNGNQVTYHIPATSRTGNFWRVATTDVDTDEDGLTNAEEHQATTNPDVSDTDGDGMLDGWEIANGLNPKDDGTTNPNNGADGDPDGDGIKNPDDSTPQAADELFVVVETEHLEVYSDQDGFKRNTSTFSQRISIDRLMVRHPAPSKVVVPIAIASFDSQSDFGFLDKAKIRLQAASSTPFERTFCFFNILDTNFPSILSESPSVVVREPVELKIPAGEMQSTDISISPGVTDLDKNSPDLQQAVLMNKVEVYFQPIQGWENLDNHVDPWDKPISGKRVFPDSKNPDDIEIRNKLEIVVKTSPALVGKKVFLKSFDVDDSTDDDFDTIPSTGGKIIDINGPSGSDNLPDYLSTNKDGHFWNDKTWGSAIGEEKIDSTGEAKFIFRVGMQPGNNYRVVASVIDESMYAGVQVAAPAAAKYLGPALTQNGGACATPLLTVWRKLWVEEDTMWSIGTHQTEYSSNDIAWDSDSFDLIGANPIGNPQTATGLRAPTLVNDRDNMIDLQNGSVVFNDESHSITATLAGSDYDVVQIEGDFKNLPAGTHIRIYDDDGFGLSNSRRAPFLITLVGIQMKNYFKSAFIEPMDGNNYNPNQKVPFRANVGSRQFPVPSEYASYDIDETEKLWVSPITLAYQGERAEDNDPLMEAGGSTYGVTANVGDIERSLVFVETCRDDFDSSFRIGGNSAAKALERLPKFIIAIAAHEMGHQPGYEPSVLGGNHHDELQLMREGGPPSSSDSSQERFSATTVERFRKSQKWCK